MNCFNTEMKQYKASIIYVAQCLDYFYSFSH